MKNSCFITTLSFLSAFLIGLGAFFSPWYTSLAAPFVNPTPLWSAESDSASARLSQVAFGDFNGDGYADLAAVAPDWSNPENVEGALFVWHGSSSGLGTNGKPANADWTAETNVSGAHFATLTTGDVNGDEFDDLIASSIWYSNGQSNEGAVFAWLGSSSGLGVNGTPANADWQAESNVAVGLFGTALATGDFNGDGNADLVIGASSLANGQSSEGRTFVYLGSSSGLGANGTPTNADWVGEGNQASAYWGGAVESGDFNGDGYADLVVGATGYDNGQTDEGAAFVFLGSSTGLGANGDPTNADWRAEADQASAYLGGTLASGWLNGDAYADLTIGTATYDNGQTNEGLVIVFFGATSGLGANGTPANVDWQAEADQANSTLNKIAIGDANADGYEDILVGFVGFDNGETDEGAAFVWLGSNTGLGANGTPANATYTIQADQAFAGLGNGVALGRVYGLLSGAVMVVSADRYDNGQTDEGMLFAYQDASFIPTPTSTPSFTPSPTATNTPTHTATSTLTRTLTPTHTATATNTPTNTATITNTPTNTTTNTPTASFTPSPTATKTPTATNTHTNTPTNTPTNTATATPTASFTPSPTATKTPTATNTLTNTPSNTPTNTATATPTASPTPSPTATNTATATHTPTNTPTNTPTLTPTNSSTPSPTATSSATATHTATPSPTPTLTPSPTPTDACPCQLYLPLVYVPVPTRTEQEPNDLFTQAQLIPVPVDVTGHHDGAAHTGDVYQFTLEAGQIVHVTLTTGDPTGVQLLAYGGEAPDELVRDFEAPHELNFVATTTGTYYLYIFTPGTANNPAPYVLQMRVSEAQ